MKDLVLDGIFHRAKYKANNARVAYREKKFILICFILVNHTYCCNFSSFMNLIKYLFYLSNIPISLTGSKKRRCLQNLSVTVAVIFKSRILLSL